jgi:integrase
MPTLTESTIRAAKSKEKPYKLFDEKGLFLLVTPPGGRLWRFKFRYGGVEKLLAIGPYPDVPLKRARERRDEARRLLADRIDPSAKRQAERAAQADTFKAIALEWLAKQKLADSTREKAEWMFETLLFPYIGAKQITSITAPDVLAALRRVEAQGKHETAHRAKQRTGQVFRYAIATGRAEHDVTADLKGALAPVETQHFAAITEPQRVGELLRAIDSYVGQPSVATALKLAPLVFLRPGELRAAEWSEFDLEGAEWRIPGQRMKMGEQHVVPLSQQAIAILRDIQPLTGSGRFVFPSLRTATRSISDGTLNAALRRLGFSKDDMTGHGFRTMASTLLNEQGWHPDLIELQLAHAERNKIRAAYNRAQRLPERRQMMQAWADYLDGLKVAGAKGSWPLERNARPTLPAHQAQENLKT